VTFLSGLLYIESKMRLMHLIAESVCSGHVPSMSSSMPVVIHATASPFLG